MLKLDRIDVRILALLQEHGRMSNLELAEAIGLSPAQCSRRHHRLEESGVIARYEARLRPAALGLHVIMDGLIQNWLLDPQAFDLEKSGRLTMDAYLAGLGFSLPAARAPRRAAPARAIPA